MNDPNLAQLIKAAEALRPLLPEIVFVGGCMTGLLITDAAAPSPRGTMDVDVIAEITSYPQYSRFGERLRALGFAEDFSEGAPLCRWVKDRTILDVMPLDPHILGFSNRWYRAAMERSTSTVVGNQIQIRIITAPYFIATKFEAFKGRGNRDFMGSHDLEDVIAVVDGRESLVSEVRAEPEELRDFIREEVSKLLDDANFNDAVPGYLLPDTASQARVPLVRSRLTELLR